MPHAWNSPIYGAKVQYADEPNVNPPLNAQAATLVQQIAGTFLYYTMAVDSIMLVALGSIAASQAKATEKTNDEVIWLLNYTASNPDAAILYTASDLVSTSTATEAITYPKPKPGAVPVVKIDALSSC